MKTIPISMPQTASRGAFSKYGTRLGGISSGGEAAGKSANVE